MHAVLLAGGKGTRLRPLTAMLPKSLVPINGVPVIEHLIGRLRDQGIAAFTIVTCHMAGMVQQHLGSGARLGVNIEYLREITPLGTAGFLGQFDPPSEPFLVINADILTDLRFEDLLAAHQDSAALATVAVCRHQVSVELGVVECDAAGRMTSYLEKPQCDFWVSMGIYCLDSQACRYVARGECISMPEVLLRLRDAGQPVHCHRADCYWRDIGRPEDYAQANAEILQFPQQAALRRAA